VLDITVLYSIYNIYVYIVIHL